MKTCRFAVAGLAMVVFLFFFSGNLMAWTRALDFEQGLTGADGFSYVGSAVQKNSNYAKKGGGSARFFFQQGDFGWQPNPTFVAISDSFPSPVASGGELWTRAYYMFPTGFDWGDQDGKGLFRKILRFRVPSRGYQSVIAMWSGDQAEVLVNTEVAGAYTLYSGTYFKPETNKWYCVEQYVKFSATQGIHRVWIDGKLVGENKTQPTLGQASDVCDAVFFFTYWNGAVRTSQYAYIDDVVITTDRPAGMDAAGNPMIGPSGSAAYLISPDPSPSTPATPKNLKIVSPAGN